jgi:multimeric flavodoxin WrbA
MTLRLLGLNAGSAGGSTEIVLKEALQAAQAEGVRAEGVEVELVRLDDLHLPSGPDPKQPDDAWWFWERLMQADGLVVSAPIFSRTVPARLKLLMDRLLGPNADRAIVEKLIAMRDAGRSPPSRSGWTSGCCGPGWRASSRWAEPSPRSGRPSRCR